MAEAAPKPTLHKGVVKLVQSGDTVIIRGVPRGGPPPEKVLSLSGISAPRLARRPGANSDAPEEKDEPMAWEAREYLRKKLVGQNVTFEIEYTAGVGGRDYGTVYLGSENITKSLLVAGLVKVRREEDEELVAQAQLGKLAGLGLYSDAATLNKSVRNVKHSLPCSPAQFVEKFAGKEINAIIEHVRDGSNFRALLIPSYQSVSVGLTGIRAPSFKRNNDGEDEPFAAEAKYFVETRILQRDVKLCFEGTSGPTSVLASVIHPKGSISQLLLQEGYAKINDNSFTNVSRGHEALRAAENSAKAARKRIWKTFQALKLDLPEGERTFDAIVTEIINPERILIRKTADGTELEVALSSLRQPRRVKSDDDKKDGGDNNRRVRPLYDVPFMFEAREFIRGLCQGRPVQVTIDFLKPAEGNYKEKTCVTMRSGNTNIAEGLISRGLATCLTHDQYRSSCYDALLQAEFRAKSQKKGCHGSNHNDHIHRVGEITSKDQGQRYLGTLKRGKVQAIVEFVSSGSRVRAYVPKESLLSTFMLAGISVPRTGFKDKQDEPFAVEALNFVKNLCLQKDVHLEALDTDNKGNLIGHMFINGQNVAELLLKEGLGEVHYSAKRLGLDTVLNQAEALAKSQKKGMWVNYDESQETSNEDADKVAAGRPTQTVTVSHVSDAVTFFAQVTADGEKLNTLSEQLQAAEKKAFVPKKSDTFMAKFSEDGLWYRAKVERAIEKEKTYEVRFVDYGNTQETPVADISELSEEFASIPPFATEMKLSLLDPPPEDYMQEATDLLKDGILFKEYECSVDYADGGISHVCLESEEPAEDGAEPTKVDVAKTMLRYGYARAGRTRERHLRDKETAFKKIQAEAAAAHTGMWIYGDISEDPKDI